MSQAPHHPEARFATPAELVREIQANYRRLSFRPPTPNIVPRERVGIRPPPPLPEPPPPKPRDILDVASLVDLGAEDMLRTIAHAYGFTADDIRGPRRHKRLVEARFDAYCRITKARPDWSLLRLGRFFRRDHTTLLSALRKHGLRP